MRGGKGQNVALQPGDSQGVGVVEPAKLRGSLGIIEASTMQSESPGECTRKLCEFATQVD
jgi:hypothetical protein